jgi:hypothetical protein
VTCVSELEPLFDVILKGLFLGVLTLMTEPLCCWTTNEMLEGDDKLVVHPVQLCYGALAICLVVSVMEDTKGTWSSSFPQRDCMQPRVLV